MEHILTLQEVLYGTFTPPPVINTRHHYIDNIGHATKSTLTKTRFIFDKKQLTDWQKRVLQIVRCNTLTTREDVARKTKASKNHCGTTLTALYKANLIHREKISIGIKWAYAYKAKDK